MAAALTRFHAPPCAPRLRQRATGPFLPKARAAASAPCARLPLPAADLAFLSTPAVYFDSHHILILFVYKRERGTSDILPTLNSSSPRSRLSLSIFFTASYPTTLFLAPKLLDASRRPRPPRHLQKLFGHQHPRTLSRSRPPSRLNCIIPL